MTTLIWSLNQLSDQIYTISDNNHVVTKGHFSCSVTNVQLSLETRLDEHVWEQSRFFDAFFLICHPSYIRSSNLVIRKMMEWNNTTDELKDVQLKNPNNGKWEALTKSVLDTLTGDLDCKLNWFPRSIGSIF